MNFLKFSCYALFVTLLTCSEDPDPAKLFSINIEPKASSYQAGDPLKLNLVNKKGIEFSEVRYSINGLSETSDQNLVLPDKSLGNQEIKAQIISGTDTLEVFKKIKILASQAPEIFTYEIVNEYPHDMKAYTQGLEFHGDTLYESTGRKGQSSLRKVDYKSGTVLEKIDLEPSYFGEGLTISGNSIYQLSWQSKIGFIYELDAFKKSGSFQYGQSKEGWGLCHDETYIYKSDGTEKIWRLDPETLQEIDYIQTVTDRSIFNKANELEYVDGKIYANVWQKESMMIINARSGAIEGVVNFGGLRNKVKQHSELDVFNGIALHPERKTLFVTGKNWDTLFEVRIVPRSE